jgi:hypothetical protein
VTHSCERFIFVTFAVNNIETEKIESIFLPNDPGLLEDHGFLEGSQGSLVCPSGKRNI